MVVKIRFQRYGAPKKPFYRLVVIDGRKKRDGKSIDVIGFYDPRKKSGQIDTAKLDLWVSKGAQLSQTAYSVVKKWKKQQQKTVDAPAAVPVPEKPVVVTPEPPASTSNA